MVRDQVLVLCHHLGLGIALCLCVRLRGLREAQLEEGSMPIALAVKIDERARGETDETRAKPLENCLTWEDLPDNFDEDPREIYKNDGGRSLTLFEFLVWSAKVGGFAGQEPVHRTQSGILKIVSKSGTVLNSRTSCVRSN